MATINAPSIADTQNSGNLGLVPAHGTITLAAAQIADKVRLMRLPKGTKVHDLRMVNAALGAASTVSLGYEYVNGEAGGGAAALLAATATVAAGCTRMAVAPVRMLFDAYVTATVGGGAVTGALDVVLINEFLGE